jgi:hypothetical protein
MHARQIQAARTSHGVALHITSQLSLRVFARPLSRTCRLSTEVVVRVTPRVSARWTDAVSSNQEAPLHSLTYEYNVNKAFFKCASIGMALVLSSALTGCSTPPAKDFGGSWKPVNRYEDKTTEIPLAVPYTYYAAPMDGTLKTMLTRWTSDTGMKLSYRLRSDFTLPKATSQIHTSELRDAAAQLGKIYAPQGVAVLVDGPELVIEEVSNVTSAAPATGAAPTPAPTAVSPAPAAKAPASPDTK